MESGSIKQDDYSRPSKWVDGHRKFHNRRRITPEYWYIMLLQDPSKPWVMWKPFPDKEACQAKINSDFGNNSLFFPVKGKYLIKYNVLVSRTIKRKLGKIPQYRDKDERIPTSKLKGLEKY